MLREYRHISRKSKRLIFLLILPLVCGCSMAKFTEYSINEIKKPDPIRSDNWEKINMSQNRFFISDDFINEIVYERIGTNGLIGFSIVPISIFENPKFEIKLMEIYRKLLLPPHNDLRVYSSGKFVSFEESVSRINNSYFQRAEFVLKGEMGLKIELSKKKEKEKQLHALEPFSGPYSQKELKRARDFRNELLNLVDKRQCRVKVIVYLYEGKLFKFLYINIPSYFEKDLELFHTFERSLSKHFSSKKSKLRY